MSTKGKKKPEEFSREQLQPLIDYCANTQGGMAEVIRRFEEITGEAPPRCQFQRWLHPKVTRRKQMLFGAGTVLVKIHKELTTEEKK